MLGMVYYIDCLKVGCALRHPVLSMVNLLLLTGENIMITTTNAAYVDGLVMAWKATNDDITIIHKDSGILFVNWTLKVSVLLQN